MSDSMGKESALHSNHRKTNISPELPLKALSQHQLNISSGLKVPIADPFFEKENRRPYESGSIAQLDGVQDTEIKIRSLQTSESVDAHERTPKEQKRKVRNFIGSIHSEVGSEGRKKRKIHVQSPGNEDAESVTKKSASGRKKAREETHEIISLLSSDDEGPDNGFTPKSSKRKPGHKESDNIISLLSSDDEGLSPGIFEAIESVPNDRESPLPWIDNRPIPSNNVPMPDSSSLVKEFSYASSAETTSSVFPDPGPHKPDVVPITEPELCKEQADLVDLILSGKNVFYTGSAGCGKSTVLKAFVKRLRQMGKEVNIIAPTGRAALDINGSTTWTYAGWTPDSHKKPLKRLRADAHGKFVRKRLKATDVLVIDEISMVENLHFERLNKVMQEARDDESAFGGVQLVVTGDFCQLPPVKPFGHCMDCGRELQPNSIRTVYKCAQHGEYYDIDKWAFRSAAWAECDFAHVHLTTIHRQSDKVFIDILQKCRSGASLSWDDADLLLNHPSETENAVKLFSTREEVRRINQENFNRLQTRKLTFICHDYFYWNEEHRNLQWKSQRSRHDDSLTALQEHRFDVRVDLKEGMLVILLVNLDLPNGLVNGSQGIITGFDPYDAAKLPKAESSRRGTEVITSPVQSLGGEHAALKEEQIKKFIERAAEKAWPIVRFNNGVTRTIYADCTVNELGDSKPYSLLSRTQIPLTAAWAMSIHKSQGMTLNRVIVDLSKSFEEGQMYVALSRARSLDGLKVEGLGRGQKGGNEQVKEFLFEKFGIR